MNTVESNVTDSEQRELHAWCAEVRAAHATVARPLEVGDPRIDELEESHGPNLGSAGFTPDELGELYFVFTDGHLPAWPLATPASAVETRILSGTYPEMKVHFLGKKHNTFGICNVSIEQMHTVFVDDFVKNDGTVTDRLGDHQPGKAIVYLDKVPDELSADEATQLAIAIGDAASELRRYTD